MTYSNEKLQKGALIDINLARIPTSNYKNCKNWHILQQNFN